MENTADKTIITVVGKDTVGIIAKYVLIFPKIYVSADHKGVIALGEKMPLGKFTPMRFASSGVISPGLNDWRTW